MAYMAVSCVTLSLTQTDIIITNYLKGVHSIHLKSNCTDQPYYTIYWLAWTQAILCHWSSVSSPHFIISRYISVVCALPALSHCIHGCQISLINKFIYVLKLKILKTHLIIQLVCPLMQPCSGLCAHFLQHLFMEGHSKPIQ